MCNSGAKRVTPLSKKRFIPLLGDTGRFAGSQNWTLAHQHISVQCQDKIWEWSCEHIVWTERFNYQKIASLQQTQRLLKDVLCHKWCVDTALELLTEMSWQEYLNIHEGTNNFQHSTYSIVVKYGSWTLLGTRFSAQVFYAQNEFFNLRDVVAHINSVSSCTSHFFLKQSYWAKSTCIYKPSPGKHCKIIGKQPNLYQNTRTIAQRVWAQRVQEWHHRVPG